MIKFVKQFLDVKNSFMYFEQRREGRRWEGRSVNFANFLIDTIVVFFYGRPVKYTTRLQ